MKTVAGRSVGNWLTRASNASSPPADVPITMTLCPFPVIACSSQFIICRCRNPRSAPMFVQPSGGLISGWLFGVFYHDCFDRSLGSFQLEAEVLYGRQNHRDNVWPLAVGAVFGSEIVRPREFGAVQHRTAEVRAQQVDRTFP